MYENILVEKKVRVGIITINRPEIKNAFDETTRMEFRAAVKELQQDKNIRVIIITGAGNSFSTGQDLKAMYNMSQDRLKWLTDFGRLMILEIITGNDYDADPKEFFDKIANENEIKFEIGENWKPVIAQVNGYAIGGGFELACACDFRFASDDATFMLPEIDMRIIPGWGGSQNPVALFGLPVAKYVAFTGERIPASKAKDMGLVNDVFKAEDLENETMKFAKILSQKHPGTLRFMKIVLETPRGDTLLRGLALEHEYLWKLDASL
ncbi:MAG TPA: enoyl-CoA hydratase/isomerase family protein [Candidatus Lokiarchaeia archaeon]|nr:enoyl-CoA hydratase/isomerase family protein [Candidatus Lokiarchaeia archaeon]